MARAKARKPSDACFRLSAAEIALIERLVRAKAPVAVPQIGSAKPRRVVAASLDPEGHRILLYLSAKPIQLTPSKKTAASG